MIPHHVAEHKQTSQQNNLNNLNYSKLKHQKGLIKKGGNTNNALGEIIQSGECKKHPIY